MATQPKDDRPEAEAAEGVLRRRKQPEPEPATESDSAVDEAQVTASGGEAPQAAAAPRPVAAPQPAAPQEAPTEPPRPKAERPRPAGPPRTVEEDEHLDFGALLEAEERRDQVIEQGTIVEGTLAAFGRDWAFVDLGAKTEGVLAIEEITDAEGGLTHGIGDPIETFVTSTSGGEIRLSFTLGRQIQDADTLLDAFDSGVPVEGKVVGTNKGGFDVRIGGRRAFCPISQIDLHYTEDPEVHVGQTYTFKLKEVSQNAKRVVVSRADFLRAERDAQRQETLESLSVGDELAGVVTSLQEYGAFVDLGGVEGLIHISELSWSRVEHPSEVVKQGEPVHVKVLSIKHTQKGDRIGLSLRETLPHPWVQVGTKFVEGESYTGTVTRLEPFGAFVELGPGVEGLVHVSELSWTERVNHPREVLSEGQEVRVYIKRIDEERRRIGLSVKALESDPWRGVRERYPAGTQVEGTVEKVQPFGVFVEVEPGLVALIPASESDTGSGADLRRQFEPGKKVTATVLAVDPGRRRMSLSLKAAAELQDQTEIKQYLRSQEKAEESGGFGTLGDLFRDKLE